MNLFDLTGKVAVITGSSRGIGRAIAERMAEHGAKVVISSRKPDACEQVAAAINARHGAGTAIADRRQHLVARRSCSTWSTRPRSAFGQIDVLVCNAASNPYYGPMAGISDEQFRKILDNNIVSNHWLISMVVPRHDRAQGRLDHHRLVDRRAARLDRSSAPTASPRPPTCSWRATWRCEYGPHNVRVNCIAPGLIKTDFAKALWDNPET